MRRMVMAAAISVACACEPTVQNPDRNSRAKDPSLRIAHRILLELEDDGCRAFIRLRKAMEAGCDRDGCTGRIDVMTAKCASDNKLSNVAILLLERPATSSIGLEIACGLCAFAGRTCACDGTSCSPDDILVRGDSLGAILDCGTTHVDGSSLRWGSEVRKHPVRIAKPE